MNFILAPNPMPAPEHPEFNFCYFSFLSLSSEVQVVSYLLTANFTLYHICLGYMILLLQFGIRFLLCTLKDILGNQHLSSSFY